MNLLPPTFTSLRPDRDQIRQTKRCACALAVAHVGIVVVVYVDIRDLLQVASADGVDDMHGAGGTGFSIRGILIAGRYVDLASINRGGSGERVGVADQRNRGRCAAADVEQEHGRQLPGDNDNLGAVASQPGVCLLYTSPSIDGYGMAESRALSKQIQTDLLRGNRLLPRQAGAEALGVAVNYAV